MRRLPFLVLPGVVLGAMLALAAGPADAKPVRGRPAELEPPPYAEPAKCARAATWQKFARCHLRMRKHEIVKDLPSGKLVAFDTSRVDRPSKQLSLFLFASGQWIDTGFYAEISGSNELLGIETLANDTYQLELGYSSSSWVTVDEVTNRPALMRRTFTYVCNATARCRQMMTSCELLVHGKTVASFRGEPVWDGTNLKVRADTRNTNRYCAAPANVVAAEPVQ